jgi:hypothetical protein
MSETSSIALEMLAFTAWAAEKKTRDQKVIEDRDVHQQSDPRIYNDLAVVFETALKAGKPLIENEEIANTREDGCVKR